MSTLNGTAGNDNLNGGSGDDILRGAAGNDALSGGSGADALFGDAGADKLTGGSGNDTVDGGSGSDSVAGDAGNDTLVYNLSENLAGAAQDVYTGGAGTDTVVLQLSSSQWHDAAIRAQLQNYVQFLATVARNGQGEVSNGSASDFVFNFGGGTQLTVQMTEKLAVAVQGTAGGPYTIIDHGAAWITGPAVGASVEAGGVANATPGSPGCSGDLTADDLDGADDLFQPVAAGTATAHGYGSYSVTSAGVWSFVLDNTNASVQELNAGAVLTDSFKVKSADGTEQLVTVTINGSNDAAVITGTDSGSVVEAGGVANASAGTPVACGNLYADDVDNPDNIFQPVPAGTLSIGGYGSYAVSTTGVWTYTLNNGHSAVQALNVGASLSDSFTVSSADGTSRLVTLTINGSNDAAVITGTASATVTEAGGVDNADAGSPAAGADLQADDVDNQPDLFIASAAKASSGGYGSYSVDANGAWHYALDNANADVQAVGSPGTELEFAL